MTDRQTTVADATSESPHRGAAAPTSRSTPLSERALAPDLARGMMLLLIALAHVPYFLYTAPAGQVGMHPVVGSIADRVAQAFTLIVVDGRVYTMFAFLFAYGIGQMYARQTRAGVDGASVRRVLRRRHVWMIVFGLVHAVVLWQGDIIGAYGLIGLIMVPLFFGRSDRTLKVWIGVLVGLAAASALLGALGAALVEPAVSLADGQRLSIAESEYLVSAIERVPAWLLGVFGSVIGFALPAVFLVGVLAARHRLLDEPARHLALLRHLAVWGILVGWLAGAVVALQHVGVIHIAPDGVLTSGSLFFGTFTGVGYAAVFGLIAHRVSRAGTGAGAGRGTDARSRGPIAWISALGRRSLSGYLAQSLAWGPVLAAWGLGLGAHLSSWSAALYAVGVWALTVLIAAVMDRRGIRGPAEVALRRLSYGKPRRVESASAK